MIGLEHVIERRFGCIQFRCLFASPKEVSVLTWSNVVCTGWRLESITRGLVCMT